MQGMQSMSPCPRCNFQPIWHYCRSVSQAKKDLHFAFVGCAHAADVVGARFVPIPDSERDDYEARWAAAQRALATTLPHN